MKTGGRDVKLYDGSDERGFVGLCRQWEAAGFWPEAAVREALAMSGTFLTYIEAVSGDKLWAGACFFRNLGQIADLLYIYVAPEFRGRGLADQLMNDMVGRLRQLKCERLLLEVRPHNTAAIKLYESMRMNRIATRKRYYENGDDALIFQLSLV